MRCESAAAALNPTRARWVRAEHVASAARSPRSPPRLCPLFTSVNPTGQSVKSTPTCASLSLPPDHHRLPLARPRPRPPRVRPVDRRTTAPPLDCQLVVRAANAMQDQWMDRRVVHVEEGTGCTLGALGKRTATGQERVAAWFASGRPSGPARRAAISVPEGSRAVRPRRSCRQKRFSSRLHASTRCAATDDRHRPANTRRRFRT